MLKQLIKYWLLIQGIYFTISSFIFAIMHNSNTTDDKWFSRCFLSIVALGFFSLINDDNKPKE